MEFVLRIGVLFEELCSFMQGVSVRLMLTIPLCIECDECYWMELVSCPR